VPAAAEGAWLVLQHSDCATPWSMVKAAAALFVDNVNNM
jgi:hypothetical protein